MKVSGVIENIIYRNDDNGYTVFLVNASETVFTFIGNVVSINTGESIEAEVEKVWHEEYGEQYKIINYKISVEYKDTDAIEKFLKSLKIKGVGEAKVKRIVDTFGVETLDVIKNETDKLYGVKGLDYEKITAIREKVLSRITVLDTIIELEKYNLGPKVIEKIIEKYGSDSIRVLNENPYKLAIDIEGIGFAICDKIAVKNDVALNSEKRIEAGILYVLETEYQSGNVYVTREELVNNLIPILQIGSDINIDDSLYNLESNLKIKTDKMDDVSLIFLRHAYSVEKKLSELLYIKSKNITIITGGPGTGKTYNIKKYLSDAVDMGLKVALAAPTGRAAKRINEVTGYNALTIHRLLECSSDKNGDHNKVYFNINEDNKLDVDLLIVDEMSMVDEYLMYALIRAVPDMTNIILVGDVDQLPSVGAGQVLKDMIDSGLFEVKKLDKIFRQVVDSHIVMNAHLVNEGKKIDLKEKHEDFMFVHKSSENAVRDAIKQLVATNVPNHFGISNDKIQVICPSKVGGCGVEAINTILQNELNPENYTKSELKLKNVTFRVGDKVMQTANNYNIPYDVVDENEKVIDRGVGVFNGDIGEIVEIDEEEKSMVVRYDDRVVYYIKEDLSDIALAYAITVHKSQGSEYDVVIMPMVRSPYKLMTRKILYTAMTRAKKCIIFVGSENYFDGMVKNQNENVRNSALCSKLYRYDI